MTSRYSLRQNISQTARADADSEETTTNMDKAVLDRLFSELSDIKALLRDIRDQQSLSLPTSASTTTLTEASANTQVQIVDALNSVTTAITNFQQHAPQQHSIEPTEHVNASRIKQAITQTWNKSIEFRKHHFWQHIRNKNLAETYERWIQLEPIVLPAKLQVVKIPTETSEQTKLRECQVRSNYKFEIEKLKLLAASHHQKYQSADENMESLIKRKCTGAVAESLKQMWLEEVRKNENISQGILEKKNKPFNDAYEKTFQENHRNSNPFLKDYTPKPTNRNFQTTQNTPRNDQALTSMHNQLHYPPQRTPEQGASTYSDAVRVHQPDLQHRRQPSPRNYSRNEAQQQTVSRRNQPNNEQPRRSPAWNNYEDSTTYIGQSVPYQQMNRQGNSENNRGHFLGRGRGRGRRRPQF